MAPKRAFRQPKSEDQEKLDFRASGRFTDGKKCSDLGENISSDLGLADFDFDVPDELLANVEMPTSPPVSNVDNNLSNYVFNNRSFSFCD